MGFICGSAGKESTCNDGELGSIPGLGRSPGEGTSYPLSNSGPENSMDCDSDGKVSAYNVGDLGLIPGSVRSPGEGNGNPLQYSCLESSMDGGAWQATVRGVAELDTTERLQCQMSWSMGSQSVGHD